MAAQHLIIVLLQDRCSKKLYLFDEEDAANDLWNSFKNKLLKNECVYASYTNQQGQTTREIFGQNSVVHIN